MLTAFFLLCTGSILFMLLPAASCSNFSTNSCTNDYSCNSNSSSSNNSSSSSRQQHRHNTNRYQSFDGLLDAKGRPSGRGKMVWQNGDSYIGDFVDGKFHGLGKKTWMESTSSEQPSSFQYDLVEYFLGIPVVAWEEQVRAFVDFYSLGEGRVQREDFCRAVDVDVHRNASKLFPALLASIDRSVDPFYSPRVLSTNQISWKTRSRSSSGEDSNSNNNNTNSNNNSSSASDGGSSSSSTPSSPANSSDSNNTNDVVHPYLVFAIVLPNHPFSIDLLTVIHTVAPLYPHVHIVVGSGYDFQSFCDQYNVRSFPKLLFFKNGLLLHKKSKIKTASGLAIFLSKWTVSQPKATPAANTPSLRVLKHRFKARPPNEYEHRSRKHTSNGFASNVFEQLHQFWKRLTARPLEPIAGSSDKLVLYDEYITLFSLIFVVCRLAYRAGRTLFFRVRS